MLGYRRVLPVRRAVRGAWRLSDICDCGNATFKDSVAALLRFDSISASSVAFRVRRFLSFASSAAFRTRRVSFSSSSAFRSRHLDFASAVAFRARHCPTPLLMRFLPFRRPKPRGSCCGPPPPCIRLLGGILLRVRNNAVRRPRISGASPYPIGVLSL